VPEASAFMLFVLASLALLIVPGPAVVYIVARSIDQGRWAGIGFPRLRRLVTGSVYVGLAVLAVLAHPTKQ